MPYIAQKKGSVDCGPACLMMVLEYYGIKKTINELKKELKIHKVGTYATQLGIYLLENGFAVEIVTQNPGLFTIKDRKRTTKQLLREIKEFSKIPKNRKHKKSLDYYEKFFKKGGMLKVKIPNTEDIKKEISQGRPLIALMTTNFLYDVKKRKFNFHFNVITGIDGKYIYANDPLPDKRGGKKKYPIEDFLYGVYASSYGDLDNASFLKIKKL